MTLCRTMEEAKHRFEIVEYPNEHDDGNEAWLELCHLNFVHENAVSGLNDYALWLAGDGRERVRLLVAYAVAATKMENSNVASSIGEEEVAAEKQPPPQDSQWRGAEVLGSIAIVRMVASVSNRLPMVCLQAYYVRPDWRGRGLGTALFERALAHKVTAASRSNLFLYSVERMSAKYASRYGFDKRLVWKTACVFVPIEHANLGRLKASASLNGDAEDEAVSSASSKTASSVEGTRRLRILDNETHFDWPKLCAYSRAFFGVCRDGFVRQAMSRQRHEGHSWPQVAVDEKSGAIVGLVNLRLGYDRVLMPGPWFAETAEIAETLLLRVLESVGHELDHYKRLLFIFPDTNRRALEIVERLGEGHSVRSNGAHLQFTRETIEFPVERLFGLAE